MAGEGQIAVIVAALVLARNYVLDVMSERTTVLRKEAIFATVSGSGSDEKASRRSIATRRRKGGFGLLISGLPRNPPR